jgi:very-short-patch-repair endonuclease
MDSRRSGKLYPAIEKMALGMRHAPTKAEAILWRNLRAKRNGGAKWRRQQVIGRFIVDFYCPSAKLVVELDGPVHETTREYDEARSVLLEALGLTVVRYTNDEVIGDTAGVLAAIAIRTSLSN